MNEAPSQSFSVHLFADSSPLYTFQPFTLGLELTYPKEYHPDQEALVEHLLRNPSPNQIPPFDLLHTAREIKVLPHSSLIKETLQYELEPLLPGYFPLTFLQVTFLPNEGIKLSPVKVASPISFVTVHQKAVKEVDVSTEMAPLATLSSKQPIEMNAEVRVILQVDPTQNQDRFNKKAIPWNPLGFLLGLLILTFLMMNILSRKKQIVQKEPPVDSLKLAEGLLSDMKKDREPTLTSVKNYIYLLSRYLREYLEKTLQTKISTQTTEEFLNVLVQTPKLTELQQKDLLQFIDIADRIKFEKYRPNFEECEKAYQLVREIVSI